VVVEWSVPPAPRNKPENHQNTHDKQAPVWLSSEDTYLLGIEQRGLIDHRRNSAHTSVGLRDARDASLRKE